MKTTLNEIRKYSPCAGGWEKLLSYLGKTKADDEPLSLLTILDSNGLDDALWCLRAVEGHDREIRLFAVWCARQVQHLLKDQRSLDALDVAERYANGQATKEELNAARAAARAAADAAADAAGAAAWEATADAAWDAAWTAEAAAWGARASEAAALNAAAAWDAAWDAAWEAAGAAVRAAEAAARAAEAAARAAEAAARAARDAAWAAGADAEAKQEAELRRICKGA